MSWRAISDEIEAGIAAHENRKPYPIFHPKRKYSVRCTKIAYKQEKALQAFETLTAKQRKVF